MAADAVKMKILLEMLLDEADVTRGIKKLDKTEEQYSKRSIDRFKASGESIQKVALKIGAVVAAWKTAEASLDSYLTNTQLAAATQGREIGKLEQSFRGLIETTDAMRFAAELGNSTFQSTNQEMRLAAKFAVELASRTGRDVKEAFEAVKKAMTEANAEGLKEWGVQIRAESDTLQGYNQIVAAMGREMKRSGGEGKIAGEDIRKANVSARNAIDDLKTSIGQLVAAGAPLIRHLANSFKGLAMAIGEPMTVLRGFGSMLSGGNLFGSHTFPTISAADHKKNLASIAASQKSLRQSQAALRKSRADDLSIDKQIAANIAKINASLGKVREDGSLVTSRPRGRGGRGIQDLIHREQAEFDRLEDARERREILGLSGGVVLQDRIAAARTSAAGGGMTGAEFLSGIPGVPGADPRALSDPFKFTGGTGTGTSIFDSLGAGLDPKAVQNFANVGTTALSGLERAGTSAFASLIKGTDAAGEAFKKMSGQVALGLGAEMGIMALKSAGMAVVSAFTPGGQAAAAGHLKAAAMFGGFSAVALATAAKLGAGDVSLPTAGASLGGGLGGGAGLAAGGPNERTIIYGDDFVGRSPRQRANEINHFLNVADEEGDRGSNITFD